MYINSFSISGKISSDDSMIVWTKESVLKFNDFENAYRNLALK